MQIESITKRKRFSISSHDTLSKRDTKNITHNLYRFNLLFIQRRDCGELSLK